MLKGFPKVYEYCYQKQIDNSHDYKLEKIETDIIEKFQQLIQNLENIPQVHLCARGDSKATEKEYNDFFDKSLSKIFIVGEKARSNVSPPSNTEFMNIHNNNKTVLINELNTLILEVNKEIKERRDKHDIFGSINDKFIIDIKKQDIDTLNQWKIFFLSFLHNNGKLKEFKNHSPFLSVTHGCKKYMIARKFALDRVKHEKATIYLYSLNAGDPHYVMTKSMIKILKEYGVRWLKDINNEIMLINGMFPHYMLGVFEVEKDKTSRFIMNPWLYKSLKENEIFDHRNGLKINQENFNELAISLGYSNFFFLDEKEDAYISGLSNENKERVIVPM